MSAASTWPSMEGTLFTYFRDEYVNRVAFRSGSHANRKHVVLIGGLGDGLLPVPYTQSLAAALDRQGWSLVQALLSSSYTGFGHASLKTDAEELGHLVSYLQTELGSEAVGLVGHSTGCQDSVFYVKACPATHKPHFIVLQAPVSDREHLAMQERTPEFVALAQELQLQGKGDEMLPRASMWAPITANRFLDLATKEGLDDFFSSDLSDEELRARLGHLDVPTLFLMSGADEYVPPHVDCHSLGNRFVASCAGACPLARAAIVDGALHSCRGHEEAVTATILHFVGEVEWAGATRS